MGNGEAGTFHPVALAVFVQLEHILETGGPWSQQAVMESLIDLGGSFIPEQGHEHHEGVPVKETLRSFIHSMRPVALRLASKNNAASPSARELLELIDDQSA